jgi:arsenate reductase (glutaredoxin)
MILYGFKGCDMVRAAMKWLDANGVAYTFVDYRKAPLNAATIDDWFARAGWERVFNRNATTFKALPEREQADVTAARARQLMLENTNFIKRPLLDTGDRILLGFREGEWEQALRTEAAGGESRSGGNCQY